MDADVETMLPEYLSLEAEVDTIRNKRSLIRSSSSTHGGEESEKVRRMEEIKAIFKRSICVVKTLETLRKLSDLRWGVRVRLDGTDRLREKALTLLPPALIIEVDEPMLYEIPVMVVKTMSELPVELLYPSPTKPVVLGFSTTWVTTPEDQTLSVIKLSLPRQIYIVDALEGGGSIIMSLKAALESNDITKVTFDCKRESEPLFGRYGIRLNNVADVQIAHAMLMEYLGEVRGSVDPVGFAALVADRRFCGVTYRSRHLPRQDPMLWNRRPLSEVMISDAADNVRFFQLIFERIVAMFTQTSLLWHLFVRCNLHCKSVCMDKENFVEWPPYPEKPDHFITDGDYPPDETTVSIQVPSEKRGLLTRHHLEIMSLKTSSNADMFFTGISSPKIYLVGPEELVAEIDSKMKNLLDIEEEYEVEEDEEN